MPRTKRNSSPKRPKRQSDKRETKANYEFDVYSDVWKLDANKSLNFRLLEPLDLNPQFESNFRRALADYACEFSASYVLNIFIFCRLLFRTGVRELVEEANIINFKATLKKENQYKLGYIRAFLLDWHDKNFKGIDKDAVELLTSLRLSGNTKGKAVALGCPHSGAYSFEEQVDFINWYVDAYTDNLISLTDYAFIIALQQTGARPVQLTYLYFGDLITRTEDGTEHFDVKLPNAKKRDQPIRSSFQLKEAVGEDLILALTTHARYSIKYVEEYFGIKLSLKQKKLVPIFINKREVKLLDSFTDFERIQKKTPDLLCMKLKGKYPSVSEIIRKLAHLCPLKTSRIKIDGGYGDLHINPRRFRYTHATNMQMQGASDIVIAEELGHSDTQQVKVYTEFNEEIAEHIDDALAPSLTPLAQAFSGTLLDSEKDAVRANDPRSRINNDDGDTVGNCGKFGFCANGAIHCYTCNKFQPWVNAQHEKVLMIVETDRDRKRKLGASEFVLQAQNRTIDAIKVVIQRCKLRKEEMAKEGAVDG
ncbi:site-specific integrase [Pseudoalteromonas carrageenovora]|uniref:site-specific integrase n=1 Tax=Pseudoalteromonas carrageenovora TaxID=227 RepID=UPI0026E21A88|nr:site-specific integrase [Pseudoalteromonas carrageenovora]MDO6547337.1 site-specific integrase [Pseudoalteromonas carrageenovora]MDO6831785.1 site-specific integrase [Pseudoalteromonas carrageenovora]